MIGEYRKDALYNRPRAVTPSQDPRVELHTTGGQRANPESECSDNVYEVWVKAVCAISHVKPGTGVLVYSSAMIVGIKRPFFPVHAHNSISTDSRLQSLDTGCHPRSYIIDMQFKTLLSAALFGAALADLQTIQSAITSVNSALTTLDTSIKAIQGTQDTQTVLTNSQAVQTAITGATTQVQGTSAISLTDALQLQQSAQGLTTTANTTVSDLIAKKQIIQSAGQTQTTLQSLQGQQQAANGLAQAITSKVPSGVQNIAMQQTMQISAALNNGIAAFGGQPGAAAAPRA